MNLTEYSKHRGVTPAAVSTAVRTGRISRNADGTIDPEVADREWAASARTPGRKPGAGSNADAIVAASGTKKAESYAELKRIEAESLDPDKLGKLSFADAKTLKENLEAKLKHIEVQKQLGQLLDREEVAGEIAKQYRIVRDALLNIPSRLAAQIAALTEIADIQDVLADEIRSTLEELSGTLGRIAEGNPQ